MSEPTNLIDPVEEIEIVVPLSVEEVEALLKEQASLIPGPIGTPFFGSSGSGTFWLRMRRWHRRAIRPTIEGTYEAFAGGTRITAKVAMPWWSRHFGRLTFLVGTVAGLATGAALYSQGHTLPAVAMGLWMPIVSVFVTGYVVADAAAERGESTEAFRTLFDSLETADLLREEEKVDATEDALSRARRLRKMREKS